MEEGEAGRGTVIAPVIEVDAQRKTEEISDSLFIFPSLCETKLRRRNFIGVPKFCVVGRQSI